MPRYRAVETVLAEMALTEQRLAGTPIKIPETVIWPSGVRGYVMRQTEITNDPAVDVGRIISEKGNTWLKNKFEINDTNFRGTNVDGEDVVYMLDVTLGRVPRILRRLGVDDERLFDRGIKTRAKVKTIVQRMMRHVKRKNHTKA